MTMSTSTTENATRAEAAAFLRVTLRTLRDWERRRIGPPVVRLSPRRAIYPWAGLRVFLATSALIPTDQMRADLEVAIKAAPMPTMEQLGAELKARHAPAGGSLA